MAMQHTCDLLRTQLGSSSCSEMGKGRTGGMNTLSLAGCPSTASLIARVPQCSHSTPKATIFSWK